MVKTIVILAKSIKKGGLCIAGKDIESKEWIRPVHPSNPEGTIPLSICYRNGCQVQLFDIVEIDFTKACPTICQPENVFYNEKTKWVKKGNIDPTTDLVDYVDNPNMIFYNNSRSVDEGSLNSISSLYLVEVENLVAGWIYNGYYDKYQRKACFNYNDSYYQRIAVTDPGFSCLKLPQDDKYYLINHSIITVSLTEPFNGNSYKILANILA